MFEIFRMQLRQMLGGKRKWLVMLCLVLPVLLTLAAVGTGGLGELRRKIERERARAEMIQGELPDTAKRVTWQGKDLSFVDGVIVLKESGLEFQGSPVDLDHVFVINSGHIIVRDGGIWIDPSKKLARSGWHIHSQPRRRSSSSSGFDASVPSIELICAIYLFLLYAQAVCLLLALFYGTSVLGDELDGKTLTYLFTRPIPRWHFVVGKYLGIVTALIGPSLVSLLASWALLGAPGGVVFATAIVAGTVGGLLAYVALFVLFGFLIPRRAMIVALLYAIFFELILSFVPALVNEFTITYYLRSLVVGILDLEIPREIARMVGGASPTASVFALVCIVVASLGLASMMAARKEYVVKDSA